MADEVMKWLSENEGPLAWLVLASAALAEYVAPFLPGDTITLFGTFLVASAGWAIAPVYVALLTGSIGGSLLAYGLGAWAGRHEERWPAFLRRDRPRRAIERVLLAFERHGALLLVVNRFLPAFRAFVFVGAGMAGLPLWKVAVLGGASAAAWSLLILVVGWSVGSEWDRLQQLVLDYTWIASAVLVLVALGFIVHAVIRRRRPRHPDR
jgi:membrane protein DedA with SNARE-associated domain